MKIRRPYSYETGKLAPHKQENGKHTLYHHGILGMKWGRKNGPPYPLGPGDHSKSEKNAGWRKSLNNSPKRSTPRSKDLSDEELQKVIKRKNLEKQYDKVTGQDKTKAEYAKDMADATVNSARQLKNMLNEGGNKKPEKIRPDLSGKTDKELRDAINRENLERQYTDLFGEEKQDKITKGKRVASRILDGTTGALTLASLGLSIAIGVKALKGAPK